MVLRLDDDLVLDDALDPVEEAWLEDVEDVCVLAADSELYCDGSTTTEVAMKVVVENEPSASDTKLCRVKDNVVNGVRAAAEAIEVSVTGSVIEGEIEVGSVFENPEKLEALSTVPALLPMILISPAYFATTGTTKVRWQQQREKRRQTQGRQ